MTRLPTSKTIRTASQSTTKVAAVSLGKTQYGTAQPQVEICLPKGTSHRLLMAELHKLAAEIELATPEQERWIVQTDAFYDERGRVYLELSKGTAAETERAMAVLTKVMG